MTETREGNARDFQGLDNEKRDKQQRQRFVGSKLLNFAAGHRD
jgi:hypothetical protein